MAKGKTASHADLMKWLGEKPPAERINVTIKFGDDKKKTTVFHFKRMLPAYDRFLQTMTFDKKPLEAAMQFLLDTVEKLERPPLAALLNAYPGEALTIAGEITEGVYGGELEVTLKNASTPAVQ